MNGTGRMPPPPPAGRGFDPQYVRVEPPKNFRDIFRFLRELLGGFFHRFVYILRLVWDTGHWILFTMTLIALFEGVTPVIGSLISKSILNELQRMLGSGAPSATDFLHSEVFFLLIFLFVYRILKRVVHTVSSSVNRIAGEKVVCEVKLRMMRKSKELDLSSFDRPAFYEKLENANREAGNRPIQILSQLFSVVSKSIELISYVVILTAAPWMWWAIPILIAVSVPSAVINFIYRKKNFQYVRRRSKERRQMNYYSDLLVNKDMVKEVRVFGLADTFIERYRQVFGGYYSGLRRLIRNESIWNTVIAVVSSVVNCGLFLLVALQVFEGKILIGDYTLFTGAITGIATCVSSLISTSATVYEGTLFIDNLIFFMNEKATVTPSVTPPVPVAKGGEHTIEFVHVSFRYPDADHDVIHDVSLTFRPGETVVLVGLNGAGKTTLIKLLTRLYDPTEGYILLDGRDLREYDVAQLYRIFGIIFQDFGKYACTVEDNIRFGNIAKKPEPGEIRAAAEQSNAADDISRLPEGYRTPLMRIFEPDGTELSIGQWQKLAIARAFYADSDILILDEPTASLDPMAEQEIFNQFDRLRKDKTTIFVSHRLSSATVASKIVVLEYGSVLECGTHAELMRKKGRYCELFSTQAKRYLEESPVSED